MEWRPASREQGENAILSQSDPTDHVLAAIASIFDFQRSHRETDKAGLEDNAVTLVPQEADGYSKSSRAKWPDEAPQPSCFRIAAASSSRLAASDHF